MTGPSHNALAGTLIVAACLPWLACGAPSLDDRMAGYEEAVRSLLDLQAPVDDRVAVPLLPRKRDRRLDAVDHRIGMLDFLAIQGCRLSEVIGNRNSGLGKVMVPTQRLVYELELLAVADECLGTISSERAVRIEEILSEKRKEIPLHVWNAVWLGSDMESFLATASDPFTRSGVGEAALGRAADVVTRPIRTAADARELEQALGELRNAYPTGVLLRRLAELTQRLDRVSVMLESRALSECRVEQKKLMRVFEEHYLTLQPMISQLDRSLGLRLELLSQLFSESAARLAEPPPRMQAYHSSALDPEASSGAWRMYRDAILRHVRAWEPTLRACGRLARD